MKRCGKLFIISIIIASVFAFGVVAWRHYKALMQLLNLPAQLVRIMTKTPKKIKKEITETSPLKW